MKKYILDLTVTENTKLHDSYVLLKMTHTEALPEMHPGQFAEIRVDNSPTTFLRRPISINYVDTEKNEVWFLVRLAGDGLPGDELFHILQKQIVIKDLRLVIVELAALLKGQMGMILVVAVVVDHRAVRADGVSQFIGQSAFAAAACAADTDNDHGISHPFCGM